MADISDLPVPTKSADFSDLPVPSSKPSVGQQLYAGAYGLGTGIAATPGELEKFGAYTVPEALGLSKKGQRDKFLGRETLFPTMEEVQKGASSIGIPAPAKGTETAQTVGEFAPAAAAGVKGLVGLGKFGATKIGQLAKGFKTPEPIAEVKDLSQVGEKGYKVLQDKASKLYDARAQEAEANYNAAFDAARQAQAKGQPFATSPQGQKLLQQLENEKAIIAGGKKFAVGEEQVAGIDRLINAIKGKTIGGETVPVGKGKITSTMTKKTPSETTEKDVKALVEELRFLRDVDAKGKPYEAYAGLSADYKRGLKNMLEKSLHEWSPEYRVADEAYKASSVKLAPFRTELMSKALKGEKFNPKDLVASPEEFGSTFFKDVDGVRQLKEVTQDPAEVAGLGKEYVASLLSNKTPAQVKSWAADPANTGWLKEAGINDAVQNYAQKAKTAASRQSILKNLGYGTAITTMGYSIGRPIAKSLGL